MKLTKRICVILSLVMVFSCIPLLSMADSKSGEGPSRGDEILEGKSNWATIGSPDRICEVKVTVDSTKKIKNVVIVSSGEPLAYKEPVRTFKKGGLEYYKGKTLKYVLKMDTDNACGAHVVGNKTFPYSVDYAAPAKVVKNAVLNALGYKSNLEDEPSTFKTFEGEAELGLYHYDQFVKVTVNKDGRIVKVEDNGTDKQSNYGTSDNRKRIELFFSGKGYDKFKGKNAAEVKAMYMGKHGTDSVSGATYNAKAAQRAILSAMSKSGLPEGEAPKPAAKVIEGVSKQTSKKINNGVMKVKVYLDKDNVIEKVEDNSTYPAGDAPAQTQSSWSDWDNFARYRGLSKFMGMDIEDVSKADTSKTDSPYVAYKHTDLSTMTKEAILDAFEKAGIKPDTPEEKELKALKAELKDKIAKLVDISKYRPAEQEKIKNLISEANDNIDKAQNKAEAEQSFETAKKAILEVKTDEDLQAIEKAKDELAKEIIKARELMKDVKVSKDGKDIYTTDKWVPADVKEDLERAIDEAEKTDSENPAVYANLKSKLELTEKSFSESIKNGTKEKNTASPKKPTITTVKGITYKILNMKKDTAVVVKAKKNIKKAAIPNTVKIGKAKYKVVQIGDKAFKNNKKLKTVVIGANVKTIGKEALRNCKSLRAVKFNGKAIAKIGKSAFKGTHKKITVKIPKKVYRKYIKMLKKAGISRNSKYKKA